MTEPDASAIRRREELAAHHGFELDRFQVEAMDALDAGRSVLVAAPTSSGKTVVAEYAIGRSLDAGQRLFYTTPIKALSNQKFRDLSRWLGADRVGLLTGDNAIRGDAPIVVMTTEVLRNMIYVRSPDLEALGHVVLDEVHYLQDTYRGPVWEEVIIHLPLDVQLVCLSATVSNSEEVAEWICEVRGPTAEIVESSRPVPLRNNFLLFDRGRGRVREYPTLRGRRPNDEVRRFLGGGGGRREGRQSRRPRVATPRRLEVIDHLASTDRLPVIYFLFSRQGCEDAVRTALQRGLRLTRGSEPDRIAAIVAEHVTGLTAEELDVLGHEAWLEGLVNGYGAHHAGMVPPFKEAVEECFARGLLRAVFATETLAMGVNLPARSVVIESLSRWRGEGHVFLTPADYTQLTGRAGRRGIDDVGHAFTLWSRHAEFDDVAGLVASTSFELRSAFRPTYNMTANLIDGRRLDEVEQFLQRSFAQFTANREIVAQAATLERERAELRAEEDDYRATYGDPDESIASASELSALDQQREREIDSALRALEPGDLIRARTTRGPAHFVTVGVGQRRGGAVRVRAVTSEARTIQLARRAFLEPPEVVDRVRLPQPFAPYRPAFQKATARMLAPYDNGGTPRSAPADADGARLRRRIEDGRRKVARLERRVERRGDALVRTFGRIRTLLDERGYLEGSELTDRGRRLQRIFHDRDLLVAEALHAGLFDDLGAAETAALASTFTYEHRSPQPAPPPWFPSADFGARFARLSDLATDLRADERRLDLPETAEPDPGFVGLAHGWTLGLDLGEVLDEDDVSGGDFVRQVRQLVDLLGQLCTAGPTAPVRDAAKEAIRRLDRDLVAASSQVTDEGGS